MILAWLVFPIAGLLTALGIGLLVEWVAGRALSAELLMATGLAGFVVLADFATLTGSAADIVSWTPPAVAAITIVARRSSIRRPLDRFTWLGALLGCSVLAAPFVLSWSATFGGYGTLGDTAVQMLGAQLLPTIGRTTDGLDPSTVTVALHGYFAGTGYPSGAQAAVGILTRTVNGDIFATYTPYLVLLSGALGLAAGDMFRTARTPKRIRAVAVAITVAAPLATAYVWQGSIKEIATTAFVATAVAAVAWWLRMVQTGGSVRIAVVPAVAIAATQSSESSLGAAPWIGIVLLFALAGILQTGKKTRSQTPRLIAHGAFGIAVTLVLSLPALVALRTIAPAASSVLSSPTELGNLQHPLPWWQPFAPWGTFDYRRELVGTAHTIGTVGAVAIAAMILGGIRVAVSRRSVTVVVWIAACVLAWISISHSGSPWVQAKAMAIAAPALFGVACIAVVPLAQRSKALAAALLLIPVGAVALSDVQAYRGVSLAPRARLQELRTINAQIKHSGATLMTEFDEFAKVALADSAPEIPGDAWRAKTILGTNHQPVGLYASTADVATIAADRQGLRQFRYVIVRRGPASSWPPGFRIRMSTTHYIVFERDGPADLTPQAVKQFSGPFGQGAGRVACRTLPADDVAEQRADAAGFSVTHAKDRPAHWFLHYGPAPRYADIKGPGHVSGTITVPTAGDYRVWVEGSFTRTLTVRVGTHAAGTIARSVNETPQPEPAGTVHLPAGAVDVMLTRTGSPLLPGAANDPARAGIIGNVWLERTNDTATNLISRTNCPGPTPQQTIDWAVRLTP